MAEATILGALSYLPWQWLDTQGILLFLSVLLVAKYISELPPKDLPPGPFPLPFFGNMLSVGIKDPISAMSKFVETYGDVSRVDIGVIRCLLLSGYKSFKEAFVEHADAFTDRPAYPLNDRLCKGMGLISSSGHMWRQQRRFALSTLKYFGVGKKTLENSILEESQFLCDALQVEQGMPFDPHCVTNNAVANIVCTLVFGHRFDYDNKYFHEMLKCSDEVFQLPMSFSARLYNQYPTLMNFLPGKHQSVFSSCNKIKTFIREEVQKHKEDRNPLNPRDYIDCYLEEIEKNKDAAAGFTEENLIYCVVDLFGAGTETTSNTLRWAMLYMAKYPKIQANYNNMLGLQDRNDRFIMVEVYNTVFNIAFDCKGNYSSDYHPHALKEISRHGYNVSFVHMEKKAKRMEMVKVQAEIDSVIGQSRQPTMEDRVNMPYTYAVIHEIQRFANIVPFTPPRVSNKDTTIAGFRVPKGMMVLPLLKLILEDKDEYATPDQFNPEHFLDENGKFLKRENFIPFSIGKRMCPGEQLARMELFLFFTSLLQRFTFSPPKGQELTLEAQVGITCGPKPFKICAFPR